MQVMAPSCLSLVMRTWEFQGLRSRQGRTLGHRGAAQPVGFRMHDDEEEPDLLVKGLTPECQIPRGVVALLLTKVCSVPRGHARAVIRMAWWPGYLISTVEAELLPAGWAGRAWLVVS